MKLLDGLSGKYKCLILKRKDFKLEEKLQSGIVKKQILFKYPYEEVKIFTEDLIQFEEDIYIVKESSISGDWGTIVAKQDTSEIEGNIFVGMFEEQEWTAMEYIDYALRGTEWRRDGQINANDKRSISISNPNGATILEKVCEEFFCEIKYDAYQKKVYMSEQVGRQTNGIRFIKGFNLGSVEQKHNSNDFYTRMVPVGADGITIESVNNGRNYLENLTYSKKIKCYIWEDTNYTTPEALKEAAQKRFEEISKPSVSYSAKVIDIAKINEKYKDYVYEIGDVITLSDVDMEVNEQERVVSISSYPDEPEKNTVEFANRTMSFADMQKKLLSAANQIQNIGSGKQGVVVGGKVVDLKSYQISGLEVYHKDPISNAEIDNMMK